MVRELQTIIFKEVLFEPLKRDAFQEPSRHDPVGVDVLTRQGKTPADDYPPDRTHRSNSRTSVTSPVTAAAATMAGLINSVRPVGEP